MFNCSNKTAVLSKGSKYQFLQVLLVPKMIHFESDFVLAEITPLTLYIYFWTESACLLLKVLCSINSIIHNPRAPVVIYRQSKGGAQHFKDIVQDCGFEHLVPVIEMWADELASLKVRRRWPSHRAKLRCARGLD